MINFLPPHTVDGQGHEGDMLNLIFIAKRDDLEDGFERAGWLKTDKSKPTIFSAPIEAAETLHQVAHGQALRVRESAGLLLCPA